MSPEQVLQYVEQCGLCTESNSSHMACLFVVCNSTYTVHTEFKISAHKRTMHITCSTSLSVQTLVHNSRNIMCCITYKCLKFSAYLKEYHVLNNICARLTHTCSKPVQNRRYTICCTTCKRLKLSANFIFLDLIPIKSQIMKLSL